MAAEVVAPAMEVQVRGATVPEAMTLLAVLRGYVAMEIARGEVRESFLFIGGMFAGPNSALARLRAQLVERTPVCVTMVSHETLAGLTGKQVSAMELVLDPEGKLGT